MAWLDDHPPARSQFRFPRREEPSGVCVVHTAENTPDWVAFDGGAEAVAGFVRNRSDAGSYHDLGDSDSSINLVRYDAEAYGDGTGSNPHAYHVSVATRADVWPLAPPIWRAGAVRQAAHAAARYARWLQARRGFLIPPRRITRAQSEARMPGFISHAERDPGRRSDPGAGFPWDLFFAEYTAALGGTSAAPDDVLAQLGVDMNETEFKQHFINLKDQLNKAADARADQLKADVRKDVIDLLRRHGAYLATGKEDGTLMQGDAQPWIRDEKTVTLADLRDLVAPPPPAAG